MRRIGRFGVVFFGALCVCSTAARAEVPTVYVDDHAGSGGDGSFAHPVASITKGIGLLPAEGPGRVVVFPGTYVGRVVVTRPSTIVEGRVTSDLDDHGYLTGFERLPEDVNEPDHEVVITTDKTLEPPHSGPPYVDEQDLFEVQASGVELHRVVLDSGHDAQGRPLFHNDLNSAFSAKAEGTDHYHDIVFDSILVRGQPGEYSWQVPFDTPAWFRNADVVASHITMHQPGYVGINPTGDGHVVIDHADISHQEAGVCFLGPWDRGHEAEEADATLVGELRDSRIRDGEKVFYIFPKTAAWQVFGRGKYTRTDILVNLVVKVSNVTVEGYDLGGEIVPMGLGQGQSVAGGLLDVDVSGVTYSNTGVNTQVEFYPIFGTPDPVNDTTVRVLDGDHAFSWFEPPGEGNHYILVQPDD